MSNQPTAVVRRALISVSDKTGIVEFAQQLNALNIEILSTGGTYKLLKDSGISVTEVSAHTGFPEMMDGRVKTLHPKIHGGILARRGTDEAVMADNNITPIDLVVVNLYPFENTVARPDCSLAEAIENIDIGGPTMVRAAAKNHQDVTIVVNVSDYEKVLTDLTEHNGATSYALRFDLAIKAYEHTAAYDGAIAKHLANVYEQQQPSDDLPEKLVVRSDKAQVLRYGENPHQSAAFYTEAGQSEVGISNAEQLQGKALSYNNVADTDAALECVKSFEAPACVIVKHANPCGVATADTIQQAYLRAFATDPESAFGGIIAFNRALDENTAADICERQFVEVIIAPGASDAAQAAIAAKKNLRLLICQPWSQSLPALDAKRVNGGLLIQDRDIALVGAEDLTVVTKRQPTPEEIAALLFSWKVAKMVKSNAIIYGKALQTIGVGAGQMSRVNSARIAAIKAEHAGLEVNGACMASDAFFPFRDGIDNAAKVGISCVIQPGGSIRDDEVIAAADEHNMAMVFTGMRHFRH